MTLSRFTATSLALPGVVALVRQVVEDDRGSLTRLFCAEELTESGWRWPVAQINHTFTAHQGTVRGLHFQHPPHSEAKLVTCIRGRVWDVVVDLRADSPTFLQWCAQELSSGSHTSLLIPPGFAHGFQSLCDEVELLYLHSTAYCASAEAGINPLDPLLSVSWPLPISTISDKDSGRTGLTAAFEGLRS